MTKNIEVLAHSSIRIKEEKDGQERYIYADPFQVEGQYGDADVILVTHDHFDHFSPEDIAKVCRKDSVLVVPVNMAEKAQEAKDLVGEIVTVAPGETVQIESAQSRGGAFDPLKIDAVPAYNVGKQFHPKEAGWVGYIVYAGGKSIYIAGDTDVTEDAKSVKCDIALLPVGGTYTTTAVQAAELAAAIRPAAAVPTHYGSIVGKPEEAEEFARAVKELTGGEVPVEIKMEF